jgi:ParB family chromosome partitioning protein
LIAQSGEGQQEIAEKLGMARATLANFLRLLKLPGSIKEAIVQGKLDQGHARALLALKSDGDMLAAAAQVMRKGLSVRQVEMLVKKYDDAPKKAKAGPDPDIVKMENRLTHSLATKVKLDYARTGKGKVEIFFNSLAEFERLYAILCKEK